MSTKFDLFDITTNTMEHVILYQKFMFLLGISYDRREAIMCKVFSMRLKGTALAWFNSLMTELINYFEKLVKKFRAKFTLSIKVKKEAKNLFTIT